MLPSGSGSDCHPLEVLVAEVIQAIQELGSLLTASESLLPCLAVIQFAGCALWSGALLGEHKV